MNRDLEHLLAEIEYEYTDGNSFTFGEDDLIRWMLEHGWMITPPPDFQPHVFFTAQIDGEPRG